MSIPKRLVVAAPCAALALACATGGAQAGAPATAAPAVAGPEVPAAIALPATEKPALRVDARGTQNYECRSGTDGSPQWALVAPEAELVDATGKPVGRHYAGPTWESLAGSKAVAKVTARADAPEADAVPWLLLTVTEASGDGLFANVKSVQRVDTHGGKPPAEACTPGAEAKVPYRATYWFSRAR
jgi:hypothetical protein